MMKKKNDNVDNNSNENSNNNTNNDENNNNNNVINCTGFYYCIININITRKTHQNIKYLRLSHVF